MGVGALLATVLASACPAPAAAQTAPDCDTTGNSEILRTGKPITLSVNCFDADGDTVTLTHSTPAHGTLSAFVRNAQTGYFDATYTPAGSYTGPDAFTFQAHAGSLNSATFGFDLIITDNHAPHCDTNGTFHAKVGQTIKIGFFCTDQDTQDQHLTYTPISAPAHGTLSNQQDFQVDYTPAAGYTGEDSLHAPRLRRRAGRHLLPDAPRRQHAAVLDPAGDPGPLGQEPLTSPSTARGPTTTSAPTATRSSPRRRKGTLSPVRRARRPRAHLHGQPRRHGRRLVHHPRHRRERQQPGRDAGDHHRPVDQLRRPICDATTARRSSTRTARSSLFANCTDPDDDNLTYTAGAAPGHGTSATSDDGVVYTADSDWLG